MGAVNHFQGAGASGTACGRRSVARSTSDWRAVSCHQCNASARALIGDQSDAPAKPCEVLGAFTERVRNYSKAGAELAKELPVPNACAPVRLKRAVYLLDWRLRVFHPECLRRTGDAKLIEHAAKLAALPSIERSVDAAADADAAAAAATRSKMRSRIINYGLTLLEKQK